ncbi:MAG: hypothetical protein GKB99_05155 [Methanocellales archaeon]|nr:hypothetical protein [Methanocellales archaeon]
MKKVVIILLFFALVGCAFSGCVSEPEPIPAPSVPTRTAPALPAAPTAAPAATPRPAATPSHPAEQPLPTPAATPAPPVAAPTPAPTPAQAPVIKGAAFDIDYRLCTGCDICAEECAFKYQPEDYEGINIEYSRIRTMRYSFVDVPNVCHFCGLTEWSDGTTEMPCQYVCPTNAIETVPDEETVAGYYGNGYKRVNADLCLGFASCGKCTEICEQLFASGVIYTPDGVAQVCTACAGQPTCVEACPEACLRFVGCVPGRFHAADPTRRAEMLYSSLYSVRREL